MKTIEQLKKLILKPKDNSLNEQLAALSSWDYGSIYRGSDIYTSGTWTPHTYTVGYDWSYQVSTSGEIVYNSGAEINISTITNPTYVRSEK